MNERPRRRFRFQLQLVSPAGLAAGAALIAAAYAVLHLAGAREHLSLLAATSNPQGSGGRIAAALAYAGCHLLAVLVAPVLLGAAAMWASARRLLARRQALGKRPARE